jgi:hypothetical protein
MLVFKKKNSKIRRKISRASKKHKFNHLVTLTLAESFRNCRKHNLIDEDLTSKRKRPDSDLCLLRGQEKFGTNLEVMVRNSIT